MGIVFPNPRAARHWDGARTARMRLRPIEKFMRDHAISFDASARDSDHVQLVISYALNQMLAECDHVSLSQSQQWGVGLAICELSSYISSIICNRAAWRIAALRTIGMGLRSQCPWSDMALVAVSVVRRFEVDVWNENRTFGALDEAWLPAAKQLLREGTMRSLPMRLTAPVTPNALGFPEPPPKVPRGGIRSPARS